MSNVSTLIVDLTNAWLTWTRLYEIAANTSLTYNERRKACVRCEELNETISKYVDKINTLFGE